VRNLYTCLTVLLLLLAGGPARAVEADLSVNLDAARLALGFPIGNNLLVDGSWLYHDDHGHVVSLGGHVVGAASGADPLQAGVGVRLNYILNDRGSEEDGTALALGGFVRYTLPQYDRISFGGNLYFAPKVLSFGDVEKFYEVGGWAAYSILKDADLYLGWRTVRSDFNDDGTRGMDSGFHVGLRARF
jgi:hypothetical protein